MKIGISNKNHKTYATPDYTHLNEILLSQYCHENWNFKQFVYSKFQQFALYLRVATLMKKMIFKLVTCISGYISITFIISFNDQEIRISSLPIKRSGTPRDLPSQRIDDKGTVSVALYDTIHRWASGWTVSVFCLQL